MKENHFWGFYLSLDREIKTDFRIELMARNHWGKSTFYTRMKGGPCISQAERESVDRLCRKYKKLYGL